MKIHAPSTTSFASRSMFGWGFEAEQGRRNHPVHQHPRGEQVTSLKCVKSRAVIARNLSVASTAMEATQPTNGCSKQPYIAIADAVPRVAMLG